MTSPKFSGWNWSALFAGMSLLGALLAWGMNGHYASHSETYTLNTKAEVQAAQISAMQSRVTQMQNSLDRVSLQIDDIHKYLIEEKK